MLTPARQLTALANHPVLRWIGLMSGTSCDGIDAVLVEIQERTGELPHAVPIGGRTEPFEPGMQAELIEDLRGRPSYERIAEWDARLGAAFAQAAVALVAELGPAEAVALSGHTFAHFPRARSPSSVQLGNPALVARRLGVPVVAGFRAADVANGGEGAPLVPAGDRVLFGHLGGDLAVLNLGGISNITWLPAGDAPPRAADCGPCNLVLNRIVRDGTRGAQEFDRDGALALGGHADEARVAEWMRHAFFVEARRSTGREEFGENWVEDHGAELARLTLPDRLATAVAWVAQAVAGTLARLSDGRRPRRVIAGGGGVLNRALVRELERRIGAKVEPLERVAHGVDARMREAAAFAVLGNEWLRGRPGSFPSTTGCRAPLPLGAMWT